MAAHRGLIACREEEVEQEAASTHSAKKGAEAGSKQLSTRLESRNEWKLCRDENQWAFNMRGKGITSNILITAIDQSLKEIMNAVKSRLQHCSSLALQGGIKVAGSRAHRK
ncbi:hypothetical protein GOP47_0028720 [Adiantum capillus-veneris]|nr:hypothetical protein GOP47_0028720 [Adiantum capillus-veneris]